MSHNKFKIMMNLNINCLLFCLLFLLISIIPSNATLQDPKSLLDGQQHHELSASVSAQLKNETPSYSSLSSLEGPSVSASAAASATSSSSSSGASLSSLSQVYMQQEQTTTSKPEGLFGKMKVLLKGGAEKLKSVVEDKESSAGPTTSASASISSSGQTSITASSSQPQSKQSSSNESITGSVKKAVDGIVNKPAEMIHDKLEKGKDFVEGLATSKPAEMIHDKLEKGKDFVEGLATSKPAEMIHDKLEKSKELVVGLATSKPAEFIKDGIEKGRDLVSGIVDKVEDKAKKFEISVSKTLDENVFKPLESIEGSGHMPPRGRMLGDTEKLKDLTPTEKLEHLQKLKLEQEAAGLGPKQTIREIIDEARRRNLIPATEDSSVVPPFNSPYGKTVTLDMADKFHEISKLPIQHVVKPFAQALGFEKDPVLRGYDNFHELIRKPINNVAGPVEAVFNGAFKTSEESKREDDIMLSAQDEYVRREAQLKEEKEKKEDRSVIGNILDKAYELREKPFEIILKPIDHILNLDKDGKKGPILSSMDAIYGLTKKPIDVFAKPIERILRKMGDENGNVYEVSVRFHPTQNTNPKLVTRFADASVNILARCMKGPLELIINPLSKLLGYDKVGKRNPITIAGHAFKNATKVGIELFTRPVDRLIKEISDIGESRTESQRVAEMQRQKKEASKLVRAFDKIHRMAQIPFEIVLKPISKVLGEKRSREPIIAAWDVVHQVLRVPLQIISKPIEEHLFGEEKHKKSLSSSNEKQSGDNGQVTASATATAAASSPNGSGAATAVSSATVPTTSGSTTPSQEGKDEHKRNHFIEGIKKVEKFYFKPIEVITTPLRVMILGKDVDRTGTLTDKLNRDVLEKTKGGKVHSDGKSVTTVLNRKVQPDEIVLTAQKLNNVALKPLEYLTQPINDLIWRDKSKDSKHNKEGGGNDSKAQAQAQAQAELLAKAKAEAQAQQQAKTQAIA